MPNICVVKLYLCIAKGGLAVWLTDTDTEVGSRQSKTYNESSESKLENAAGVLIFTLEGLRYR